MPNEVIVRAKAPRRNKKAKAAAQAAQLASSLVKKAWTKKSTPTATIKVETASRSKRQARKSFRVRMPTRKQMSMIPKAINSKRHKFQKAGKAIRDEVMQIIAPSHAKAIPFVVPEDVSTLGLTSKSLRETIEVSWTGQTESGVAIIHNGDKLYKSAAAQFVAAFWDPFVQMVYRRPDANLSRDAVYKASYPGEIAGEGAVYPGSSVAFADSIAGTVGTVYNPRIAFFRYDTGAAAYGEYHPVGTVQDKNSRVFWVDSGAGDSRTELDIISTVPISGMELVGQVVRWINDSDSEVVHNYEYISAANVAHVHTFLVPYSGYFSVRLSLGASIEGVLPVRVDVTMRVKPFSVTPHVTPPQFYSHLDSMNTLRVNGVSVLMSNISPTITKGGLAFLAEVNPDKLWYHYSALGVDTLESHVNIRNFTRMTWNHGLYTYVKPLTAVVGDQGGGLRLGLAAEYFEYGPPCPLWRPLQLKSTVLIEVHPPNVTAAAGQTQWPTADASIVLSSMLTFVPATQWFTVAPPKMLRVAGLVQLARAPQFFQNETHWEAIKSLLGRVAPHLPAILGTASVVGGALTADPFLIASGAAGLIKHFAGEVNEYD